MVIGMIMGTRGRDFSRTIFWMVRSSSQGEIEVCNEAWEIKTND